MDSMPLPHEVLALVSPIMCGGTPKARAMSITWNLRASNNWASCADKVIGLAVKPSVSTSGMRCALSNPAYLLAKAFCRLAICSGFILPWLLRIMLGWAPLAKNLPE